MAETFKLYDKTTGQDLSPYVISYTWAGDLEQAGRKLNFTIAYTTKDSNWTNATVSVGDKVEFIDIPDLLSTSMSDTIATASKSIVGVNLDKKIQEENEENNSLTLFSGTVFMESRNSATYTMEFVAYDNLIYLAKSRMTVKFNGVTIRDCITNVCNTLGVTPGDLSLKDLDYTVNFIADGISGTEIIKKALDVAKAWTGWTYHVYMAPDPKDKINKLNVVRANTVIENYQITDVTNSLGATHSSSIEDMVNQVAIADKDGNITGYIHNEDDVKKYGLLQTVYKVDDKKNTEQAAKALLKRVTEHSEISALGNVQCIAGYAVTIQEEQINGDFLIVNDSHSIADNKHTMKLTLSYIVPPDDSATATKEGNVNPSPTKAIGNAGYSTGSSTYSQTENGIYSKLKSLGATDEQAAGVMANIRAEAARNADGSFDPYGGSGHIGLFQLDDDPGGRWEGYENWCKQTGNDPGCYDNQVEYVTTVEHGNIFTGEGCQYGQMPSDVEGATVWFNDNIEIPGTDAYSNGRVAQARDVYSSIQSGSLYQEQPTTVSITTTGTSDIQNGVMAGYNAWAGVTMDNGTEGCVEAATKIGSWYSPFLKQEYENGVVGVVKLVSDAGANCIPFDASQVEAGDVIVYGDNDHVVIAAGPSGDYVGNSSSANEVVHGKNFYSMGGLYPTKIIKTSHM